MNGFLCHLKPKSTLVSVLPICFVFGTWSSVLVLLVRAVVTLEHSDWLAGEMSLNLIYGFGPVSEKHLVWVKAQ